MWQLKIIIEISSRKELLGPIWYLPWGRDTLFPPAYSHALSRLVANVWGSILCRDFQTYL